MTIITTEAEAIAAGYTKRMFLEGQGASFEALLKPDADLDGAFECFCVDDPEMLVVSGWLCDTIEPVEEAAAFQHIDEELKRDGFTITAAILPDDMTGAPWEEHDGHGPVSDWTRRDKLPGELVLCDDGMQKRYYDFAGACRIARNDGWNAKPYDVEGETPRQRAAKAARADFEHLRRWCTVMFVTFRDEA